MGVATALEIVVHHCDFRTPSRRRLRGHDSRLLRISRECIAAVPKDNSIDLLVMGAYGHSPVRQFILGSTTTTMERTCHVPVLMFR